MSDECEVLVVGAGPVGLLAAIELARRGIDVRVIEKSDAFGVGSRGKGIQPRTQELLDQIGLLDAFQAIGGAYPEIRVHQPGGTRDEPYAARIAPSPGLPYPNILMVPQAQTEKILRDRLRDLGRDILVDCELRTLACAPDHVVAGLRHGRDATSMRARYLVGADGARSTVRHAMGVRLAGETLPRRAVFGDVRVEELSPQVWHRWPDAPGGQLSLCPLLGTRLFQMAAEVAPDGPVDLSDQAIGELVRERTGGLVPRLGEIPWRSLLTVSLRLADRYRDGRVFIAGDAAHIHPPTGAQGLNTGLQDAFNLGWKLARVLRGGDPALLDTYEAERRPVAERVLELSGELLGAWQGKEAVRRGTLTNQLDVNYRASALSRELRARPGSLRPGDRAPDASLRDARGRPVRLFDLLRHPGFTLLAYGASRGAAGPLAARLDVKSYRVDAICADGAGSFADDDGSFAIGFDLREGECVLVRPDGHVALFADDLDEDVLARALGLSAAVPSSS